MKFPIGFHSEEAKQEPEVATAAVDHETSAKECMALVEFGCCNIPLSYYNDRFDLKPGDIVFVEGKYEGVAGRVKKITTNFKVKLEDYKKIISVADTKVRGTFQQANMHFITFDQRTLPYRQVLSWFKPVTDEDGGYYISFEEDAFPLEEVPAWPFSPDIKDRGFDYYKDNKVLYLCLDGEQGKAIVHGSKTYEVSFTLRSGEISDLTCDCPCSFNCKHEFAVLLQLRESLKLIAENYESEYNGSKYFAVVDKAVFLSFAVNYNEGAVLELR